MTYFSTIISGAASLGVLIGLISGIFFLVLTALRWVSRVRENLYEEELKRQKRFLINNSYLVSANGPSSLKSGKSENTFGNELNLSGRRDDFIHSNRKSSSEWMEHKTTLDDSRQQDPSFNTVKVRETLEKMIETIIGGPLDGTTVGQMSTHSAYLEMFTKYHNLLCRELARLGFALHLSVVRKNGFDLESKDLKQSNLKQLIKRIVTEAVALPNIKEILCDSKASEEAETNDFKNKSYEDILATAILNKVIENFQSKNYRGNETLGTNSKRILEKNRKIKNDDDDYKSDGDWSDTSRSDQLSLTIEEYIEEVTTALNGSEDEKSDLSDFEATSNRRIPFPESGRTVVDAKSDDDNSDLEEQSTATELITSTSTWEENWLFQKKRLRSTPNAHHPVPVPMLVPNPSEDFRALVGGVDADDLSDMSDCSDSVLEDIIKTEEPPAQSLNKEYKKKIHSYDGKEKIKEDTSQSQNQNQENLFNDEKKDETSNTKGSNLKNDDNITPSGDEKWSEQKPIDEPADDLATTVLQNVLSKKVGNPFIESTEDSKEPINILPPFERVIRNFTETKAVTCNTAGREKEKCMNPVLWSDNPYLLENINNKEQRKKNEYFLIGTYTGESIDFPNDSSSSELSKEDTEKSCFSRDYYVNASKYPSGMSLSSSNQLSEEHQQKFADSYINVTFLKKQDKLAIREMQDNTNNETTKYPNIDKSQFSLPSVKELAKQFTIQDTKEFKGQYSDAQSKLESKHGTHYDRANEFPKKEFEVDYSTIPVSEIIHNLQQAAETPARENDKNVIMYNLAQPSTRMEVCRKADNNSVIEKYTEKAKVPDKTEVLKYIGKQVHSLTARSISKEFREGLKNSSYQKVFSKIDRIGGSGGESDQGDIVCSKTKSSPTPSIDLKNMKKFWEEIITASSNSTKQK